MASFLLFMFLLGAVIFVEGCFLLGIRLMRRIREVRREDARFAALVRRNALERRLP